jgi:hypothetical protein
MIDEDKIVAREHFVEQKRIGRASDAEGAAKPRTEGYEVAEGMSDSEPVA